MALKDSEAKKKWCPYVRVGGYGGNNRVEGESRCIATGCMAYQVTVAAVEAKDAIPATDTTPEVPAVAAVEGQGYCGAFGTA